jgi:hypothetical protein
MDLTVPRFACEPTRERGMMPLLLRRAFLTLIAMAVAASSANAQAPEKSAEPAARAASETGKDNSQPPPVKGGLSVNDPRAFQGYTLLAPMTGTKTYLIDNEGRVVNTWESEFQPALSGYLLENGDLLRATAVPEKPPEFGGPGAGGRIQKFTWGGELVWDFSFIRERQFPHHDITPLPNGNVLIVAWDMKTAEEAIAAGRRPETMPEGHLLPDGILEIKPTGKTTGDVVWEWHVWDHLIQDHDKTKANYGNVSAHPELIDVNFSEATMAPLLANNDDVNKLRAIGYVGGAPAGPPAPGGPPRMPSDWTHTNGVAYNARLDQIALSIHAFSEFWVIDHGTTTAEAASHKGGKRKSGGDLLYRWGNPRAYRSGANTDQRLFAQHNAHWVPEGLPGAGHILVFNNGNRRPDGTYSSVDEIELPLKPDGTYTLEPTGTYGPDRALWSYTAPNKSEFYSMLISGAQRLPNGNTLICSGISGTVFEVTPEQEVVWKYVNPVKGSNMPGGPGPAPASPGRLLPGFLQELLGLSDAQKKELGDFQNEAGAKLDALLTDAQKKQFKEPAGFGAASPERPGELIATPLRDKLKLTDEQIAQLNDMQKQADQMLARLLTADQSKQLKAMRDRFARTRPPTFGGPTGGGPGGPPGGGPGGFGGPPAPGQLLPGFLQEMLRMTAEQKKDLDEFRKHAASTLEALLSDEQKKQLKEPIGFGPGGPPRPGEIIASSLRQKLKLTDEQIAKVDELQKQADQKLAKVLTEEQAKQLKEMADRFARGGPPGAFPGGPRGGPPGGPGGPGGPPGLGPLAFGSSLFRSNRYSANYAGLAGKELTPGEFLEAIASRNADNEKQEAAKPVEQKAAKGD